jgi:hypothetical protein
MGPDPSYHTDSWEYPGQRDVYHDWNKCPDGKQIKPEHWKAGTGGRVDRCKECIKLG